MKKQLLMLLFLPLMALAQERTVTEIELVPNETVSVEGNLSEEQRAKLLEIADKCPVHRTLHSKTQIITKLIK